MTGQVVHSEEFELREVAKGPVSRIFLRSRVLR